MKLLSRLQSCNFQIFVMLILANSHQYTKILPRISDSCPIKGEGVHNVIF